MADMEFPGAVEARLVRLVMPFSDWWALLGDLTPEQVEATLPVLALSLRCYGVTLDTGKIADSLVRDREARARPA